MNRAGRIGGTAYVISQYPHVSHTFVLNEVAGLRSAGARVETFSVRLTPEAELRSDEDRREWATTTALRPVRWATLLRAHLNAALRAPSAYLRVLSAVVRRTAPGLRAKLWAVFYFAEGILLWHHCHERDLRHVHAHFANVAADIAWIATEYGNGCDPQRRWTWTFTMHGPTEFSNVSATNLRRKAEAADRVICISDFCRSQLMALVEPGRWPMLVVVHCGIDLERYTSRAVQHAPSPALEVLCVGRLVPEKGQAVLLEAVARLIADGVGIRLRLVGDGPDMKRLRSTATRLGLGSAAEFLGAVGQDQLPEMFRATDVFCLPSFAEGVPVVLMEAMASGTPVVTTRIAGISELVEDRFTGLLVAPGRADQVAEALRSLGASPGTRSVMGQAGRRRVEAEYDSRANSRHLLREFALVQGEGDRTSQSGNARRLGAGPTGD